MSLAMAQPPQSQHSQDIVDAARGVDPFFGAHCPRQQMGLDDEDASGADGQFYKKSLELHYEEEERGTDGHTDG
jgi:hypothetical protein